MEMSLLQDGIDEGLEPENLVIDGGGNDDEEVSEEGFG